MKFMFFSLLLLLLASCQKSEVKTAISKEEIQKSLSGLAAPIVKDYVVGVSSKELKAQIDKFPSYYQSEVKIQKLDCEVLFPYTHSYFPSKGKLGKENFFKYYIPDKDKETSTYSMYMQLNPAGQRFKTLSDFNDDLSARTASSKDEITKVAAKYEIKFDLERLQSWLTVYASPGSNCSMFSHSESNRSYIGTKNKCKYLDISLERDDVKVMTFSGSGMFNDKIYFHQDDFLAAYVDVENIDIDHLKKVLATRLANKGLPYHVGYNLIESKRIDPIKESKFVEIYSEKLFSLREAFSEKCSEISFAHLMGQISERENMEESRKNSVIESQVKASGI